MVKFQGYYRFTYVTTEVEVLLFCHNDVDVTKVGVES